MERSDQERIVTVEQRMNHADQAVLNERNERRDMAKIIYVKLDRLDARVGALEKHLWAAVGALFIINLGIQWWIKSQ